MELFTPAHEQLSQSHNEQVIAQLSASFETQPAQLLLLDYDDTTVVHGLISPDQLAQLYDSGGQLGFSPPEVERFAKICKWGTNITGYKLVDDSVLELLPQLITMGVQLVGLTNQPLPSAVNTGHFIALASQILPFPTLSSFYQHKHLLAHQLIGALPTGSRAVFYDDQVANVANMAAVEGVSAFSTDLNWRELVAQCTNLWQES